jgi:hypothetical protein
LEEVEREKILLYSWENWTPVVQPVAVK